MAGLGSQVASHEEYLGRKYIPELDGLRAISVLLVISVHLHDKALWKWLGGWQGVSVFFVLSGFLITTLALQEEKKRGRLSLAAFYVRRAFRIFPLYYVTLAIYGAIIFGLRIDYESKGYLLGKAMPWYLFYMQEVPLFSGLRLPNGAIQSMNVPFYQSWSLGIEEKFYLIWPLLAFVLWRGSRTTRFAGTTALLFMFALVPLLFGWAAPQLPDWNLTASSACLEPYYRILVGCLLALLLYDRKWFDRLRGLGTATATGISLAVLVVLHFAGPQFPDSGGWCNRAADVHRAVYCLAVAAFLVGVLLSDGPIQRFLRRPYLVLIGRLSYGIYLTHILCVNLAEKFAARISARIGEGFAVSLLTYLLASAISIVVAYCLFHLVEQPLIKIGRNWSQNVLNPPDAATGGWSGAA